MSSFGRDRRWRQWLAPAALALGLAILVAPQLASAGGGMDEGALLVYPDLIGRGLWPISDYQSLYGPANSVLLHVVYWLAPGTHLTLERLVGLLYRALIVFAVYAIARRRGPVVGLVAGALSIALLAPTGPAAAPWYAAVASGTWGVALITGEGRLRQATGAGLLTLATAFRPELAVAAGLAIGAACLLIPERRHLLLGAAMGLIPLLVWIVATGPGALATHFVGDSLRQSAERRAAFLNTSLTHDVLLLLDLAVAPLVLLGVWLRRRDTTLVLAAWTIGLAPQAFQRSLQEHLLGVACVGVPLAFAVLMPVDRRPSLRRALLPIGAAALVLALIPGVTREAAHRFRQGLTGGSEETVTVRLDGRRFLLSPSASSRNAESAVRIAARQAPAGARLFVGPADLRWASYNDTYVYDLLSFYRPATYYLEMNPGLPNRKGSGLAGDVRSADVLVLDRSLDLDPKTTNRKPGPIGPNRVIARDFCPVGGAGPWRVLRRCGAGSGR